MAQNDKVKGVWLIKDTDGNIIPENSEINALRTAVSTGGKLEFVKYGDAFGMPSSVSAPDVKAKAEKSASVPVTSEGSDF